MENIELLFLDIFVHYYFKYIELPVAFFLEINLKLLYVRGLRRYVRANVTFSQAYRLYDSTLPTFLLNRPRQFVKHVCSRWTAAQNIPLGNIVMLDSRNFCVRSVDSDNTYTVYLGNDDQMPNCTCYDWQNSHWLCKHFCAVFLNGKSNWDDVGAAYRCSPYFTIDADVVGLSCTTIADGCSVQDDTVELCENVEHVSEVVEAKRSLQSVAADCRQILRALTDATYLFTDVTKLLDLNRNLQELHASFVQHIPNDDGVAVIPRKTRKVDGARACSSKPNPQSNTNDRETPDTSQVNERKLQDIPVKRRRKQRATFFTEKVEIPAASRSETNERKFAKSMDGK